MVHIVGFREYIRESVGSVTDRVEKVKKVVKDNSYFDFSQYDKEHDSLLFNTRENGDVGEEQASDIDVEEGRRLAKLLRVEFPDLKVSMEVVDEWVHVNVSGFRGQLYSCFITIAHEKHYQDGDVYIDYNIKFAISDDEDTPGHKRYKGINDYMERCGRVFGETFDMTFDELVEKLDAITEYPHNHERKPDPFSYEDYQDSEKIVILTEDIDPGVDPDAGPDDEPLHPFTEKTIVYKSRISR